MVRYNTTKVKSSKPSPLEIMAKEIASKLTPKHGGNIVVREYHPGDNPLGGHASYDIIEEIPREKLLGLISRSPNQRVIFSVNMGIYGTAYGKRELVASLVDSDAEEVVKKHLDQYSKDHNITDINLERYD